MSYIFDYAATMTVFFVLVALLAGLWTMMRGQSANVSQKFMRWRVGLQFVAIIVIMIAFYFRG